MLGLYALTGWYIGMQNTRIPMFIAIGQNILNILASLLLVLVCGLGIKGVALGTLIAQWSGFLTALFLCRRYYGRMLRRVLGSWANQATRLLKSAGGSYEHSAKIGRASCRERV